MTSEVSNSLHNTSGSDLTAKPREITLKAHTAEFHAVDALPTPKREYKFTVDWDSVFSLLSISDKPVAIERPQGVPKKSVFRAIHGAALRRGFSVGVRSIGNEIYLSLRQPRLRKGPNHERNEAIVDAIENGECFEAVGFRYSLSKQRVEQIHLKKFSTLPIGAGRSAAAEEFLQPYLAHIDKRYCLACGDEITGRGMCGKCKVLRRVIGDIKSRLQRWRDAGSTHQRIIATNLIRKHNIKPEHLAGRQK